MTAKRRTQISLGCIERKSPPLISKSRSLTPQDADRMSSSRHWTQTALSQVTGDIFEASDVKNFHRPAGMRFDAFNYTSNIHAASSIDVYISDILG